MGKQPMGTPRIETNLQFASMRQIHAAVEHMERGDFECAITLADAAKGTLAGADEAHFLKILKEVSRFDEIGAAGGGIEWSNDCVHWLKHARLILKGPRIEKAIITDVEVIATIRRAIARFLAAYPEVKTPQMLSFENWAGSDLAASNE
jgi:hypothetical protein